MIPYILHTAIVLGICALCYYFLLARETFFRLNRNILLATMLLAFALPLLPVSEKWSIRSGNIDRSTPLVQLHRPDIQPVTETNAVVTTGASFKQHSISLQMVIYWVYWTGVIIFALSFLVQIGVLLLRCIRSNRIRDGKYIIIETTGDRAPCSFFNFIFINPSLYDWDTYNQVMLHEKTHARQFHSIDILLAEISVIFQWFNPFAWLLRRKVESNLEFLTDSSVVSTKSIDRESYQLSLLRVTAPDFPLSLTTNYNQSILKTRIMMLNRKTSSLQSTWKYLVLLPFLALTMVAFNPIAPASKQSTYSSLVSDTSGIEATEGNWFADVRGQFIQIQFRRDGYTGSGVNGTSFPISAFSAIPREREETFFIVRDAGKLILHGKFEELKGRGRYEFKGNEEYFDAMRKEGVDLKDRIQQMTLFFVDANVDYVRQLKSLGFKVRFSDLVPLVALDVNTSYINSIRKAGLPSISLQDLVAFKSLGIDTMFIQQLQKGGYGQLSAQRLIELKAASIDPKNATAQIAKPATTKMVNPDPVKLPVTPANHPQDLDNYLASLKKIGFTNVNANDLTTLMAQNISVADITNYQQMGFPQITIRDVISAHAVGADQTFITAMRAKGYDLSIKQYIQLRGVFNQQDISVHSIQQRN